MSHMATWLSLDHVNLLLEQVRHNPVIVVGCQAVCPLLKEKSFILSIKEPTGTFGILIPSSIS